MKSGLAGVISHLGQRIQNFGYLLGNPDYAAVRENGSRDLYRLLNQRWLDREKIRTVIDVGANRGQFIRTALKLFPLADILAFEPQPECVELLQKTAWSSDRVQIIPAACGSEKGSLPLLVSDFSPAASFHAPDELLTSEVPSCRLTGQIDVPVERLDELIPSLANVKEKVLVKIDVQGFEDQVLIGMEGILDMISVIVCEINVGPMYKNQCSFEDILTFMHKHDFHVASTGGHIYSRTDEKLLYMDVAFLSARLN